MKMNQRAVGPRTPEGGPALPLGSYHEQLVRLTACCLLWEKNFYYDGVDVAVKIKQLVHKSQPSFVADLARTLRTWEGLRHTPLWLVACLSDHPAKPQYAYALESVISRPDDMTELVAMVLKNGDRRSGPKFPKQMQRGLAKAFLKFDEYQLAKYNRTGTQVTLRDVLRLAHPKPDNEARSALWKRLADNKLATPDTWEVALSGGANKKETFERLLRDRKLGGSALLRNLRNMVSVGVDDSLISARIVDLDNAKLPLLPQQFIGAWRHALRYEKELELAMLRNLSKLPKLPGKTLLLVDVSASMNDPLSSKGELLRVDVAAALAVMVRSVCELSRIFTFSNNIVEIENPPNGFGLLRAILNSQISRGTALGQTIEYIRGNVKDCDRLIVITDEAARDRVNDPVGKGYMVNVSVSQHGVGFGPWTRIQGWSENVIKFIQAQEREGTVLNCHNER